MKNTLQNTYNFIFEESLINEILEVSKIHDFKEGDIIIDFNENIKNMPLMLTGAIKILREDFDEGELLLYFIEKGDTCAMTLTCCLGNSKSKIRANAETDGSLLMIPISKMEEWLTKYKTWRNFVFESYNIRLNEMLEAIDALAFMNLEERLYKYLKDKVKILSSPNLSTTHQEIATELHTSRVVISRVLKSLEIQEKIKIHRNKIEVLQF